MLELGDHSRGQAVLESLRDIQGNVMRAKRGDFELQQLEPELAELGENGALVVDTLAGGTQHSVISPCRSAKVRSRISVHFSSPRRKLKTY